MAENPLAGLVGDAQDTSAASEAAATSHSQMQSAAPPSAPPPGVAGGYQPPMGMAAAPSYAPSGSMPRGGSVDGSFHRHSSQRNGMSSSNPQEEPPSRVLHLRNLPYGATPHDIASFFQQFGTVAFASLLPSKGSALVEYQDVQAAAQAIAAGQQTQLQLGGRTVFVNFSRSQEINRAVAIRFGPQPSGPGGAAAAPAPVYDPTGTAAAGTHRPDINEDRPLPPAAAFTTPIVCLHVLRATAPIDVDTVLRIAESACPGLPLVRVVIFYRNGVQVLVELASPQAALQLASAVHNQFVYEDCCKIVAAPSTGSSSLVVTVQNELTRDLTRADLPTGPPTNPTALSPVQMAERERQIEAGVPVAALPWETAAASSSSAGVPGGGMMGASSVGGGMMMTMPPQPPQHGMMMGGGGGGGRGSGGGGGMMMGRGGVGGRGSIIRLLGLDPDRATARRTFNLVCSYGNVRRIQCLPPGSHPEDGGGSSALVEMEDATQANGAAGFLNGHTVFGRRLTVRVEADLDRIDGAPLSADTADPLRAPHVRDWVGSPHNRFRRPEQFRNVFAPSPSLHLANVPPTYDEAQLDAFLTSQGGARPVRVAWMAPGGGKPAVGSPRRVGLALFASVSEALETLMMANNIYTDGHTIKLATTNKAPR